MKRTILSALLIVILAIMGCEDDGGGNGESYATFDEAVAGLDTPSRVLSYMRSNVTFVFHDGCISYAPAEFFSLRAGDCKDYATFFSYILAQHGFYAEIVTFAWYDQGGQRNGHVVTIYSDTDGVLRYQSNDDQLGPVDSVDDLLNKEAARLNASRMGGHRVVTAGSTNCCSPE
jgi:hypothetical protein